MWVQVPSSALVMESLEFNGLRAFLHLNGPDALWKKIGKDIGEDMQIYVDADACPVVHTVEKVAKKYEELPGKQRPICRYIIENTTSPKLF